MNTIYETKRLYLRILQARDAAIVLSFYERNRDFLEPFEPDRVSLFYTLAFHQTQLTYEYNLMQDHKMLRLFLFDKKQPDTVIGTVSLQQIQKGAFCNCSISYKMDQTVLQKGYAFEALTKLIEIAFYEYDLHRIEAGIVPTNLASLHLIEKLGFKQEGIAHSSVRLKGTWQDQITYALIKKETDVS